MRTSVVCVCKYTHSTQLINSAAVSNKKKECNAAYTAVAKMQQKILLLWECATGGIRKVLEFYKPWITLI